MEKSFLFILVILLFGSCKENSKRPSNQSPEVVALNSNYEWVEEKIDSTMKANNIPSLSIGIVSNGKLAYFNGFGHLNEDNKIVVNENTLYQIGSDTKKFTAIIVNNLILEDKLDLDKPITMYLKNGLSKEAKRKLEKITLRKLLHHKSGIPNRAPGNTRIDGDPMLIPYTEENLLKDLNSLELDFEPGSKFGYSNFGYAVVGYICEQVSNYDYSALVKKYVADKYNMTNTCVHPSVDQKDLIATPYRKDDRTVKTKTWTMGKMTPAGGVYSNIMDISKLMIAQLKAYQNFHETRERNIPLILTDNESEGGQYGFGLSKSVDETGIRYGHGGDLDGFASGYVFSPDYNFGLILLTSSGGKWFGKLEGEIRRGLINNILEKE